MSAPGNIAIYVWTILGPWFVDVLFTDLFFPFHSSGIMSSMDYSQRGY